jgi:hypothetical protein
MLTEQEILEATQPVVFVVRNEDGSIRSYGSTRPMGSCEALYGDDPDVQAHLNRPRDAGRIIVSRLRFKLELAERGLLPGVDGTIAALPGAQGDTARLYWAEATEFESDHPLVLSIGALLDPPLSPSEIRVMFEAARDRAA